MALTDEQLEIISEALTPLFQHLEKEVIADIARRIQKTLTYTRTAELQAMAMRELGYSPAKIRKEAMKILNADSEFRKIVAKNTLEYKRDVKNIINSITKEAYKANDEIVASAGNMSWINDLSVWKDAGKELTGNSFLHQLAGSFAAQTAGELKNMTQTTGFKTMSGYESIEHVYKRELDKAVIKVCSGTFDQDKVVRDVVHDLAQSGLRSIDFANGYSMQLDTAARVALRTGCHQLAGKVTDKNIEQTRENLVYVSKHWGARNTGTGHANHEQWQGKVYYIKEGQEYGEEAERIGQDRISSLYYATGYSVDGAHENDPAGLNGYNCRHNHHPWFEGVSSIPNESPEPKSVTINGKTYDYYAMTQKQRSMERSVRALKREKEALKAIGMDAGEIDAKISRKKSEYAEFCALCGINPKPSRLRYECGTADLKKTKAWKAYTNLSFREYRFLKEDGTLADSGDVVDALQVIAELPQNVRTSLDNAVFRLDSSIGNGYNPRTREIFIVRGASRRQIIHEIGHHLENNFLDERKILELKRIAVQNLTKDDIMCEVVDGEKIYTLQGGHFVNRYQSRLYVDKTEDALNQDGTIKVERLGEFASVLVEYYFCNPKKMKTDFKDMYTFIEEALR